MFTTQSMTSRTCARLPSEPRLPAGLIELMEGMTREVLKNNPSNIYEFCTSHMQKLLEIRDGRAPKIPLTLDQKIKRAQEKVRKRAEERRRKYDEESESHVADETEITSQSPDHNALPESITDGKVLHEERTASEDCTPAQRDLAHDKQADIYETLHSKVRPMSPVTNAESKEIEIFKTPENTLHNGTKNEHLVGKIDIPLSENSKTESIDVDEESSVNIRNDRSVDDADEGTKDSTEGSKPSSFDAFIEEESLPNEEDLNNTAFLETTQQIVEKTNNKLKSGANYILLDGNEASDQSENTIMNVTGDDEHNDKDSDAVEGSYNVSTNEEDTSKHVENIESIETLSMSNKDCSKTEQLFLVDENKDSIPIAPENDSSNKKETDKVENDANTIIIHSFENTDKIDVSKIHEVIVEKRAAEASLSQNTDYFYCKPNDSQHAIVPETVEVQNTLTKDKNDKSVASLLNNVVVINEAINFGNVLDTSKQGNNENFNTETVNEDASPDGKINIEFEQDINNLVSTEETNSIVGNINDIVGINSNVANIQSNTEINASATNQFINKAKITGTDSLGIVHDDKEVSNDKNLLKVENVQEIKKPDIKVIDSSETIPNSSDNNEDYQINFSEPVCKKKTVSLLSVPLNALDEGPVTQKRDDAVLINDIAVNSKDNKANHKEQANRISYAGNEPEKRSEDIPTAFNMSAADKNEQPIVHEDFIEKPCNDNNPQNEESGIHNESSESEQMGEQSERNGFSNEFDARDDASNRSESNDGHMTMKTKDEPEDGTLENVSDSEEQLLHSNTTSNSMDLETAAITIQKHFRTFMYKRCSTFEDSSNDDHTSTDEDVDREQTEYHGSSSLNKERRTLGLNRMESVLQTVNEEKSLSLSTDESSTVSSAATVIQARVRGFLTRKKLRSSSIPLINSDERSISDDKQKKTVLNIHIVPQTENFNRDESIIESIDPSLDSSPPLSTKLHPLGYDKSEPRKQLKREDAFQSFSPPTNSDKQSDDIGGLRQSTELTEKIKNDDHSASGHVQNVDTGSCDTTPSRSTTVDTVIEAPDYDKETDNIPAVRDERNHESYEKNSFDESIIVTPLDDKTHVATRTEDKSSMVSDDTSKLIHSGEFHDTPLPLSPSPTQISRNTTVVREFKNVLGYFLLWK